MDRKDIDDLKKIHLGCGNDYWDDYINIDIDESSVADLIMDCMDLGKHFQPSTIEEIVMIQVLDYLTLWETRDFFLIAREILVPQGRLIIETVNIESCIRAIRQGLERPAFNIYLEGIRGLSGYGLDDLQEKRRHVGHLSNWSMWHLCSELINAGFVKIEVMDPMFHSFWRDMRVEASNGKALDSGQKTQPDR